MRGGCAACLPAGRADRAAKASGSLVFDRCSSVLGQVGARHHPGRLLEGAIVFGILAFVPSYLQTRFGVSATVAGATGAVFAVGGYLYVAVANWFVPWLGERKMVLTGGFVLAVAFLTLLVGWSWTFALPAGLLCGFGYYLVHSTLQTQATQMAPQIRGTAVAMFASFLFTGQSLGVWAVSQIDAHVGVSWAFALAMVMMPMVTIALATAMRRRKRLN
ncbi:MFS transporter [Pigmentiphaga litoralis]|uniref:MFS transporter n=1 Tax=Pigmentiphaga litoralis TaxID=516702 RepID=UPI003B42AC75